MDGMENLTTTEVNDTAEAEYTADESVDTSSEESGDAADLQESQDQAEPEAPQIDVNAIAAAARRQSEQRLRDIDAEYARRFGHLKNPKTGQPIRSQRDYLAALDAQEEMKAKEQLAQQGVDPSVLDNFIANNPAVRQAQAVMEQTSRAMTINQINSDVAELNRLDPSITSLDTVPPDVLQRSMQTGMNLVDAYKIANYGRMNDSQQAAIQQQAINQAKGKSHLNPVNGVATPDEGADIPQSELTMWKDMFPDKTSAELKKLYNKTL